MILKNSSSISIILLSLILFTSCKGDPVLDSGSDQEFSHQQAVGAVANHFLSSENYKKLTIEIDYMTGFRPTDAALSNLQTFLGQRLNKPNGITIILDDELPLSGKSSFTSQEVRALEEEHRDLYSNKEEIVAYFIIVDAEFSTPNVLGIAYYNTSMALFGKTIADNSGGLGRPSRATVETAVLNHEFGHILGLVGNGSPAIQDHKDEANGAHCTTESCLMYFTINTTDFIANLMGGSIPELDEFCIQDLQSNGGK